MASGEFVRAVVSDPSSYRVVNALGGQILHATAEQTGGSLGILEGVIPPGVGIGQHRHTREDEAFYVLSGRFRFWCGDDSFELGAGGCAVLPRHVRHRWTNISDEPGRLLIIVSPGGFERFFIEVEKRGLVPPRDAEQLAQLELSLGVDESPFMPPKSG